MIKLIVQIPAYNEEHQIGKVVCAIPRSAMLGVEVEVLIVDDGSDDGTVSAALKAGADHIIRHSRNRGLARTFESGISACLEKGADIIVNIDADMQYDPAQIPLLVEPIISGQADVTIGNRQIWKSGSFGLVKRLFQSLGSRVVSRLSGQRILDAVSGFRGYSRDAALDLNILSDFSYTTESILQAGAQRKNIVSIPITRRDDIRPSRLARSSSQFVIKQASTIVRSYIMYRPLRTFFSIGAFFLIAGLLPVIRFIYSYVVSDGGGHVQSLILAAALLIIAFVVFALGIVADLIGFNRKLLERNLRISKSLLFENNR